MQLSSLCSGWWCWQWPNEQVQSCSPSSWCSQTQSLWQRTLKQTMSPWWWCGIAACTNVSTKANVTRSPESLLSLFIIILGCKNTKMLEGGGGEGKENFLLPFIEERIKLQNVWRPTGFFLFLPRFMH